MVLALSVACHRQTRRHKQGVVCLVPVCDSYSHWCAIIATRTIGDYGVSPGVWITIVYRLAITRVHVVPIDVAV